VTQQVLLYERAVPLSSERDLGWSVETGTDYSFAKTFHAVPLTAIEILGAASEYPIIFAGEGDNLMPLAVLRARVRTCLSKRTVAWPGTISPHSCAGIPSSLLRARSARRCALMKTLMAGTRRDKGNVYSTPMARAPNILSWCWASCAHTKRTCSAHEPTAPSYVSSNSWSRCRPGSNPVMGSAQLEASWPLTERSYGRPQTTK
jgi:hypothetical protein